MTKLKIKFGRHVEPIEIKLGQ